MKAARRGIVVAVLVGVGALTAVGSAEAHTLSLSYAALEGRIQLSEFAENQCNEEGCDLATYPRMTRYDCDRVSRHIVTCSGTYQLITFGSYYDDEDETEDCNATIKAKYASENSITPRIRVLGSDC